jgi:hypothetical protein
MRLSFPFFDKGNYKLSPYLDAAYKAANPNQFEKTLLRRTKSKLDGISAKRKNFKNFPIPNDANNKWVSSLELGEAGLGWILHIRRVLPLYFGSLNNASKSGDYKNADDLVESINGFKRGLVVR